MLSPLPVKKMTEALTWDQGNSCSLVHGDVGVTDNVGYSPMRAQKQTVCSCCSVVCQSNHSTLMVSVVCVDCAPFLYSTSGKITQSYIIFEHFLQLSQPGDANTAIPNTRGHGEGSEGSWVWDGGSMVRLWLGDVPRADRKITVLLHSAIPQKYKCIHATCCQLQLWSFALKKVLEDFVAPPSGSKWHCKQSCGFF